MANTGLINQLLEELDGSTEDCQFLMDICSHLHRRWRSTETDLAIANANLDMANNEIARLRAANAALKTKVSGLRADKAGLKTEVLLLERKYRTLKTTMVEAETAHAGVATTSAEDTYTINSSSGFPFHFSRKFASPTRRSRIPRKSRFFTPLRK